MGLTVGMSVLIHFFINSDGVCVVETPFLFNFSPELTEVLSEDFQGPLQKVLDGIALLHLQAKHTQRHHESMKRVTTHVEYIV